MKIVGHAPDNCGHTIRHGAELPSYLTLSWTWAHHTYMQTTPSLAVDCLGSVGLEIQHACRLQVTQKCMPNVPVAKRIKRSSRGRGACPLSVIPDTEKVTREFCWGASADAIKKRLDFHAFEDAPVDHGVLHGVTAGTVTRPWCFKVAYVCACRLVLPCDKSASIFRYEFLSVSL